MKAKTPAKTRSENRQPRETAETETPETRPSPKSPPTPVPSQIINPVWMVISDHFLAFLSDHPRVHNTPRAGWLVALRGELRLSLQESRVRLIYIEQDMNEMEPPDITIGVTKGRVRANTMTSISSLTSLGSQPNFVLFLTSQQFRARNRNFGDWKAGDVHLRNIDGQRRLLHIRWVVSRPFQKYQNVFGVFFFQYLTDSFSKNLIGQKTINPRHSFKNGFEAAC